MTGALQKTLLGLAAFARRRSTLVLVSALALLLLSLAGAARFLEFQTNRDDLIGANDAFYEVQQEFLKEFPVSDDVVVMVEGGQAKRRIAFVELLAEELKKEPESFYAVFPKVELPFLKAQALQFLPETELSQVVESVEEASPFLSTLGSASGLESLFSRFEQDQADKASLAPMLGFLNGVFGELERSVDSRGRADYQSPWAETLFADTAPEFAKASADLNNQDFYHTIDEGRVHLLLLRLQQSDEKTIKRLREVVSTTGRTFTDLSIGVTGGPLLEFDEMKSSEQDSHRSAVLSIILVAILFSVSFRQLARPLAAIFCLALAVGWTVGFTTLAIGHLNLLTITFATILIGLGIDFAIHLLFRYEEEFRKFRETDKALDEALVHTGSDIVVGAISTAVAFWAVGFTDFKGVSEIGIIAGTGVILCLFSTLVVLPAIITRLDRNRRFSEAEGISGSFRLALAKTEAWLLKRAVILVPATLVFLVLAWPWVRTVGFDYNLLRLQDPSLESVQTELSLIKKGGNTILFSVTLADSLEEARLKKSQFEALPAVSRVDVISDLFPVRTEGKTEALERLEKLVEPLKSPSSDSESKLDGRRLQQMGRGFSSLQELFEREKGSLLSDPRPQVREQALLFQKHSDALFGKLSKLGPGPIEDSLGAFSTAFFQDLGDMVDFLKKQDPRFQLEIQDLPDNLRIRSVGKSGKILLRIYPKKNIWERESLREFVQQVRTADPDSIGAPPMILHHTSILRKAFESSGVYALAAVSLLLLFYFRSAKWTLLALFPLGLGIYIMLFVMGINGVHFNPANFMGLPLLLGIGLDFGIHVLHRVREEGRVNMFDHSTGPATAVSGLTTICGFGTLALGGHQGVASMGLVLASGVAGILLAALVILPAMLKVFKIVKPVKTERAKTESAELELTA